MWLYVRLTYSGAGSGIGRGLCVALHAVGAHVVAVSKTGAKLESLKEVSACCSNLHVRFLGLCIKMSGIFASNFTSSKALKWLTRDLYGKISECWVFKNVSIENDAARSLPFTTGLDTVLVRLR